MEKVAFITGGTSGIGKAICTYLTSKGIKVYGTGRTVNTEEITKEGYTLIRCDVTNTESVNDAFKYVLTKEEKIDLVVNNAGIGMAGSVEDSEIEEIRNIFNTNVAGTLRVCKAVLPQMRNQKSGLIINISSVGGLMGLPYRGVYSSSKSSVELLSEAMSMEVMKFGIKVVLIEPGDFKTSINLNRKVSPNTQNSIYKEEFDRIHEIINEEVTNGKNPFKIGKLVYKILQKQNPKMRYNTGGFSSKLALVLKRILPTRLFERLLMNHYKIKRK